MLKLSTFAVGYLSTFSNSKILKLRQKKRNGGETGGKPVEDCGVACKEPIFVTNASLFSSVDADPQWKELVDAILEADVSDSKSETYKLQKEGWFQFEFLNLIASKKMLIIIKLIKKLKPKREKN